VPTPYGPGLLVDVRAPPPSLDSSSSFGVVRLGWGTATLWVAPHALDLDLPLVADTPAPAPELVAAPPLHTPVKVKAPATIAAAAPPPLHFNSVRIVTQCVVQLELIGVVGELIGEHAGALATSHLDSLLALLQVWRDGMMRSAGMR
jgi:hypothetical protein